jgi:hypothetical protein
VLSECKGIVGLLEHLNPVFTKVLSLDSKGFPASSQGMREYISVIATLKFDILLKVIAELL